MLPLGVLLIMLTRDPAPWSELFFWILYLAMVSIGIFVSFRSTGDGLLTLIFVAIILHLIVPTRQPEAFTWDGTSAHEMQVTRLVMENGALVIGAGNTTASQFSYFPGVQMIFVALTTVTGLSLEVIIKFLAPLLNPLVLLSIYVFATRTLESSRMRKTAIIAAVLVYVACPRFEFKDAFTVYESIAIVMLPLILATWGRGAKRTFLSALMLIALVISHSFTSYVLLVFAVALAISQKVLGRQRALVPSAGSLAIVSTALVALWSVHVATARSETLLNFGMVLERVLFLGMTNQGAELAPTIFSPRGIDLVLSVMGVCSLSLFLLAGTVLSFKERRGNLVAFAFVAGMIMLTLYALIPWRSFALIESGDMKTRGIEFGYLGLAGAAGLGIAGFLRRARRPRVKLLAMVLLLLIFFPTIFVGFPQFYYRYTPPLKTGPQVMPMEKFNSGLWISDHYASPSGAIYATSLGTYYSGYFELEYCGDAIEAITTRTGFDSCQVVALDLVNFNVPDSLGRTLRIEDLAWLESRSNRIYSSSTIAVFIIWAG